MGIQEAEHKVETRKAVGAETSGGGNTGSFLMHQQEFSELLGKYLAYL